MIVCASVCYYPLLKQKGDFVLFQQLMPTLFSFLSLSPQVVEELYEEHRELKRFGADSSALRDWLVANLALVGDFSVLDPNTLEAAQQAIAAHKVRYIQ